MIIDHIKNITMYEPMVPGITNAWYKIQTYENLEDKRYDLETGYFKVQSGKTKPIQEGNFESHREYIDVQIILKGGEELAWNDVSQMNEQTPYKKEQDITKWNGKLEHTLLISEGMFYIMFPHDGHKAISHTNLEHTYKKIVLKLPIK